MSTTVSTGVSQAIVPLVIVLTALHLVTTQALLPTQSASHRHNQLDTV